MLLSRLFENNAVNAVVQREQDDDQRKELTALCMYIHP